METSKRKFWAKEILVFWVSLVVMVVAYLITLGVVEIVIYFKNREVLAYNAQLEKSKVQKRAEIDSLRQVPRFFAKPQTFVGRENFEKERRKVYDYIFEKQYFTNNYLQFVDSVSGYCCDEEGQKIIYADLVKERFSSWKTFEEFQERLFGDYFNPDWKESKKKIEQGCRKFLL